MLQAVRADKRCDRVLVVGSVDFLSRGGARRQSPLALVAALSLMLTCEKCKSTHIIQFSLSLGRRPSGAVRRRFHEKSRIETKVKPCVWNRKLAPCAMLNYFPIARSLSDAFACADQR